MSRKPRLASEPTLTADLCKLLRQGVSVSEACERLELPLSSYKDWMRWGRVTAGEKVVAKEPFRTFAREVNGALSDFRGSLLDEIRRQGRDARWASDGPEVLTAGGDVLVPEHKKGDIILNPKGYVARPGHWNANAWLLERRFPKEFAPQVRVIVEEQLDAALRALDLELVPGVVRLGIDPALAQEVFALVYDILSRADAPTGADADAGGAGAPPVGGAAAGRGRSEVRH